MDKIQRIKISRRAEAKLINGYLWVFSNELEKLPELENGSLVEVTGNSGKNFGLGFFNRNSLISIRLLNTDKAPDTDFFAGRIKAAQNLRTRLLPEKSCYRLVFGESDLLPGLIVDKYENYFAFQILSAGMQKSLHFIIDAIIKLYPETLGIILKNSSHLRALEGLELSDSICFGQVPDLIETEEFGIKMKISLLAGQKTGYYLDQSINRKYIRDISSELNVLDCFSNQGGFALNAAKGKARKVTAIDSSPEALVKAQENAGMNGFSNIDFLQTDVFDYLQRNQYDKIAWDMIILDPPSFTKSRQNVPTAKSGYFKLNRLALKNIKPGGFLATSSCSQHIREDVFYEIIINASNKEHRALKLIHRGMQSPDHPILAAMPETNYLKFLVFQIL